MFLTHSALLRGMNFFFFFLFRKATRIERGENSNKREKGRGENRERKEETRNRKKEVMNIN